MAKIVKTPKAEPPGPDVKTTVKVISRVEVDESLDLTDLETLTLVSRKGWYTLPAIQARITDSLLHNRYQVNDALRLDPNETVVVGAEDT